MTTPERILRKPEVRNRLPVGKTKFEEDIAPRLEKVHLGPRCVGFTESSVERLIKDLIAESAARDSATPPTSAPTRLHQTPKQAAAKQRS